MKKIFAIGFTLLGLIIVAALVAPAFISPETYKGQIIQLVESSTDRRLTIDGNLSLSLFPTASITAEKVTLSNPPGFTEKTPFVTLDSLKVDVEVLPLLSRKIAIKQFVLHNPAITLHATKDGKNNWMITGKPEKQQKLPIPGPKKKRDDTAKEAMPGNIMLSNFELKGGKLTYINDAKGTRAEISNLNVGMMITSSASAVTIDGSGDWQGKTIRVKAGLGTLESFLKERKMDYRLNAESSLFSVSANGHYNAGAITGKSTIKATSLKDVAAWLNPSEKPFATPAKLAFLSESDIRCGNDYCNFPNIHLVLDTFEAKGSIKVNVAQAVPSLEADLKTEALDLNPFLPAATPQQAGYDGNLLIADAIAQNAGRWSSDPIDLSGLKLLNANATINTGSIRYRNIAIGKTALTAKLQQGRFTATIPNAEMYGGTGTITLAVDGNTAPPTFEKKAHFQSIQVEPLLTAASNMDRISGTGDLQLQTTGRGNSQREIISSLTGNGKITLTNGTIKRVNLLDMLRNVQTAFVDANSGTQTTHYAQMVGTFTIAQGIVSNNDLLMQLQGMNVNGAGTINLPDYTMNYRLTPTVIRTVQDQATGTTTTKEGISVPVVIAGNLDQPKFHPDLTALVNEAIKDPAKLQEQLKTSRGAIKDQLKDPKAAVKNLKGLLKGF